MTVSQGLSGYAQPAISQEAKFGDTSAASPFGPCPNFGLPHFNACPRPVRDTRGHISFVRGPTCPGEGGAYKDPLPGREHRDERSHRAHNRVTGAAKP